ncbi:hypothetical protein SAMN06297144_2436 [Sphingomonas guangdongensis]|uniref:DUF1488 family protein n=1 Tax=Sphingomonas guangdongensis TaxID=1141890 RepID=A0A285R0K6_9SPHN|nr:hypothetical protein SAMN06297144_2436 [Sphingomonas guangdongensis]
MGENRLTIDPTSVFDNSDERQVEFSGAIDGEPQRFAVRYSVLEALTGTPPNGQAVDAFTVSQHAVTRAALSALVRDTTGDLVVISENDLEQLAASDEGPHAGPQRDGFPKNAADADLSAHPS